MVVPLWVTHGVRLIWENKVWLQFICFWLRILFSLEHLLSWVRVDPYSNLVFLALLERIHQEGSLTWNESFPIFVYDFLKRQRSVLQSERIKVLGCRILRTIVESFGDITKDGSIEEVIYKSCKKWLLLFFRLVCRFFLYLFWLGHFFGWILWFCYLRFWGSSSLFQILILIFLHFFLSFFLLN